MDLFVVAIFRSSPPWMRWPNFAQLSGREMTPPVGRGLFHIFDINESFFFQEYIRLRCMQPVAKKTSFCLELQNLEKTLKIVMLPWFAKSCDAACGNMKKSKTCKTLGATGKHVHYVVSALSNAVRGGLPENRTLLLWYSWNARHFLSRNTRREVVFQVLPEQGEKGSRKSKNLDLLSVLYHYFYEKTGNEFGGNHHRATGYVFGFHIKLSIFVIICPVLRTPQV